jgi:hypothetical protein
MRLVVYFDGQFWRALIERVDENGLSAGFYVFGGEPKDGEILQFVNHKILSIINNQSAAIGCDERTIRKINPKRLKRQASKELNSHPVSTASQAAIQKQLETNKKESKATLKKRNEEKKEYKRMLAVEKTKEKHKGR